MRMSEIIDLSQAVDEKTPAYYGDTPFTLQWIYDDEVKTSEIKVTPHVGTHVDSPMHFSCSQNGIGKAPLSTFVGDCIVAASELAQNAKALEAWTVFQKYKACGRILFKFEETRQGIAEEVVELLVKEKFVLIGTSSPSIDDEKSHDFPNHRFALSHGLCALENLVLDKVEPGAYFLSAAPIKWLKAEASPVRAYLIKK